MSSVHVHLASCLLPVLLTAVAIADPGDEFWASDFYRVGLAGRVNACAEYDGALILGGDLTAAGDVLVDGLAGQFDHAGGVAAHNVARWDGAQWHPLGGGGEGIEALVVYDGLLIALGDFSTTLGVPGEKLAAWDGTTWTALGTGPQMGSVGSLHAAVVHGGTLVVGGSWASAGPFHLLAAWDGDAWSTPYANPGEYHGPDDWEVRSLAVYEGSLIAGGHFTHWADDDDYFHGVARWDGSAWVGLAHGLSAPSAIETDDHSIRVGRVPGRGLRGSVPLDRFLMGQ